MHIIIFFTFRGYQLNTIGLFLHRRQDIFYLIQIIHINTVFIINMLGCAFKMIVLEKQGLLGFFKCLRTIWFYGEYNIMLFFKPVLMVATEIDKE